MDFDAVLLPPRRARMIEQGLWHDRTINDDLDACLAACPDKPALTAVRVDSGETQRLLYATLARFLKARPGLQIILIAGNHDPAQRLEAPEAVLRALGVHVVGTLHREDVIRLLLAGSA